MVCYTYNQPKQYLLRMNLLQVKIIISSLQSKEVEQLIVNLKFYIIVLIDMSFVEFPELSVRAFVIVPSD